MEFIKKHALFYLIFFGLLIRLVFIFWPGFAIDVGDWFAWAIRLGHFDFAKFYSKDIFTDYTPGYLYILSLLGFLKDILKLQDNFFYYLLKTPAIITDLIMGLLIYREAKTFVSEKWALFTLCLYLFNPALIFNSSLWGQIDSVLTLLMLTGVIALKKNKLIFSSAFFGLALLVKPQALALIPLFVIVLVNQLKLSNLLKITIPALLIIFILTFPFFPNQTLTNLVLHITNTASEYPYTSLFAYNLWGVVGFWRPDKQLLSSLSYQTWGYILFLGYWITVGYFYFKKKLSIYVLATLATLAFFFLPTRVHERYLYPAIVFLILLTARSRSKLLLALTGILSLLHLLNLYYVYVYYNEFYLKLPHLLYNPVLYNFLDTNGKNLSLISTIVFVLISIDIIRYYDTSKKD